MSTEGLKPFLRSHDGTQPPLHHYSEEEGLIETAEYQVERVLARQWRLGGQVRKDPFPGAKPGFRVPHGRNGVQSMSLCMIFKMCGGSTVTASGWMWV